jgi:hypothetical protein
MSSDTDNLQTPPKGDNFFDDIGLCSLSCLFPWSGFLLVQEEDKTSEFEDDTVFGHSDAQSIKSAFQQVLDENKWSVFNVRRRNSIDVSTGIDETPVTKKIATGAHEERQHV